MYKLNLYGSYQLLKLDLIASTVHFRDDGLDGCVYIVLDGGFVDMGGRVGILYVRGWEIWGWFWCQDLKQDERRCGVVLVEEEEEVFWQVSCQ